MRITHSVSNPTHRKVPIIVIVKPPMGMWQVCHVNSKRTTTAKRRKKLPRVGSAPTKELACGPLRSGLVIVHLNTTGLTANTFREPNRVTGPESMVHRKALPVAVAMMV